MLRSLIRSVNGAHIDLIRPPYSEEPRFDEELVERICNELPDIAIDLHIMSEDPVEKFESLKSSLRRTLSPTIFMHVESFGSDEETISAFKKVKHSGCKVGVVLDLPIPVNSLKGPIIKNVDVALLMSVKAGGGGRKFDPASLPKIRKVKELFPFIRLEVDGGIDEESGRLCVEAGADVLVVGSRITRSPDPFKAVESLKNALEMRSF